MSLLLLFNSTGGGGGGGGGGGSTSAFPTIATGVAFTASLLDAEAAAAFAGASTSTLGQADSGQWWQPIAGIWGLDGSGNAKVVTAAAQLAYNLATVTCGPNMTSQVTLSTVADGCGLAFRVQDPANFWVLRANSTTNYLLQKIVNGSPTTMATLSKVPANGDVLRVVHDPLAAAASSTITATINGANTQSVNDSTFASARRSGLYASAANAGRWSNFSVAFNWTDVSSWVVDGSTSTSRGKQHETDQLRAGTLTATFDNIDRRFDPSNTSSPYNGYLLPMRRIRVQATWLSVVYGVFYGFVERWPVQFEASEFRTTVRLTASDAVSRLSRDTVNVVPAATLRHGPKAYWRMGDAARTPQDFTGLSNPLTFSAVPTMATTGLIFTEPTAIGPVLPTNGGLSNPYASATAGLVATGKQSFTISMLCAPAGGTTAYVASGGDGTAGHAWNVQAYGSGGVVAADNVQSATGSFSTANGTAHQVDWVRDAEAGQWFVYVDGVLNASSTVGAATDLGTPTFLAFGDGARTVGSQGGAFQEFAVFDYALSAGQVADKFVNAGFLVNGSTTVPSGSFTPVGTYVMTPSSMAGITVGTYLELDTGTRAEIVVVTAVTSTTFTVTTGRTHFGPFQVLILSMPCSTQLGFLLDSVGWPKNKRVVSSSSYEATMPAPTVDNTKLASGLLADIAQSDGGSLLVDQNGQIRWRDRENLLGQLTPTTIFGNGSGQTPVLNPVPSTDTDRLFTEVHVTSTAGSGVATSEAAKALYGPLVLTLSAPGADVVHMPAWLLARYARPGTRLDQVELQPWGPGSWDVVLPVELGDRLRVQLAMPTGSTMDFHVRITEISHLNIGLRDWRVRWQLEPFGDVASGGQGWVVGDSVYGVLGQTTSLFF